MSQDQYEIKVDKWTFRVPKRLFYNENDCWARVEGDTATIGITDFLQNMATDIIFVKFNDVGTEVQQFDEAASYESVKAMLDVISPVSGTVEKINEKLAENPELVNKDPYGEGWFLAVKLKNFEDDRQNLLTAEEYFEVLKRKVETQRKKLGKQEKS